MLDPPLALEGIGRMAPVASMNPSADEHSHLVAREAHLRSILETIPDAMIVIDERGRIFSFSAAAEAMFGYKEAEVVGENVSMLMPSPDRERHDSYLDHYLATGERKIIGIGRVTTARHRDGNTFPIDLHIGEARIGDERVFTGFIRDLTERQQTELRLHDLQSELAHVSRITAMGTLATSLAHELNQPLTAIANYVETAKDLLDSPDPEVLDIVREALVECAAQSVRAGQIVRRLRDFVSRGETERRIESLARVVNEASAMALVAAGERGVEVEVRLDAKGDRVLVDRIQVQQVILNLIRNAIEAMAESPTRRLRISSRAEPEGHVTVMIEDSGPGLPQEVSERLFQPFVSTKSAGMGLGLSICHTIIQGHGGRIWAEPSRFGGTTFHFTLIDASGGEDG
jgi:two-component system sensor kinase FixL